MEPRSQTPQRAADSRGIQIRRASTLNAHYTSPTVISAIYDAVQRLGFQYGRVLEPAIGIGHFFGSMPAEMQSRSQLTGIEIDPVSASLMDTLEVRADYRAVHRRFQS